MDRLTAAKRIVALVASMNEQKHAGYDARTSDVDLYVELTISHDFANESEARAFIRANA